MQSYYRMGRKKLDFLGDNLAALYELAVQAAILGKTTEAVEMWEKFLALKADMPEAFVHLATAYIQCKDYRSALKAIKKALEIDPEMKEGIYNYCLCEFIIGDIHNTIRCLTPLLDQTPEFLPARLVLAAAHICAGNTQEGLKNLEDLEHTEMRSSLGATLKDLANRLSDQNRSDYARLLHASILKKDRFNSR